LYGSVRGLKSDFKFYLDDTWVDYPLWEVIEKHEITLEKDTGAPGP